MEVGMHNENAQVKWMKTVQRIGREANYLEIDCDKLKMFNINPTAILKMLEKKEG